MKKRFRLTCEGCDVERPKRRYLQTLLVVEDDDRVYVVQDCNVHGVIFKFPVVVDKQMEDILSGKATLIGGDVS